MIDWLDDVYFPEFPATCTALAEPNGLLARGGNVSPLWLDQAYRHGIFPWHSPNSTRMWWSPCPRAVITPECFHLPRTVRKLLKKPHRLSFNLAFKQVMQACSEPRNDVKGTWISTEMIHQYERLHQAKRAVSVELWDAKGELVGGFYGLLIGSALFGESMFSRIDNASKIAFASAAPIFFRHGVQLIDCQMRTNHLAQFGLIEFEREDFEQRLAQAVNTPLNHPLPMFAL